MAKHSVTFSIPERELGKADLEFHVKRNGDKLGTFKVSKGGVVWTAKNKQYGSSLSWVDLAAHMTAQGRAERR